MLFLWMPFNTLDRNREIARRDAVDKMLDYISRQLIQLEIIKQLPDARARPDKVINRATDVLSAAFCYIDDRIRREANRLGILGKTSLQGCIQY